MLSAISAITAINTAGTAVTGGVSGVFTTALAGKLALPSLPFALLASDSALEDFKKGGPIMWPILLVSFVALSVVIERIIFLAREKLSRDPRVTGLIFERVRNRDVDGAISIADASKDYLARILAYALKHRELSLDDAFAKASGRELARYQQGLAVLDTCITASPLLGLLGTVTGMIATFGALGTGDIASSAGTITGGVGEALIATTCGLAIAIFTLFPFNILNTKVEQARREIANAANSLELARQKAGDVFDAPTVTGNGGGI
ncbi:MAG: MotA/TolQ/ExbB proton channel family protein [Puniceicoccales bacterium]|jgi:biopolymer transport protein ExbB|nr:MotA/TolQ/ExbB proton channel family protein [Puniceicoccales bacterium]